VGLCASSRGASSLAELGALQSTRLHKLKGALRDFWSIDINGRWRLLFRFKDGDAFDVHIFDPH
jgi:toxin HigB-1